MENIINSKDNDTIVDKKCTMTENQEVIAKNKKKDTIDHVMCKARPSTRAIGEEDGKELSKRLLGLAVSTTSRFGDRDRVTPPPRSSPRSGSNSIFVTSESPSASQVSVGSVPPTLTSALLPSMRHHYDLTPVTRNTSTDPAQQKGGVAATVTPSQNEDLEDDSDDEDYGDPQLLHGEHLAMPSDFFGSKPEGLPAFRAKADSLPVFRAETSSTKVAAALPAFRETVDMIPTAVEFPAQRKFYSFTSRRQYVNQHHHHRGDESQKYEPYEPANRKDQFDVESLNDDELEQIFKAREESESHQNHRLLTSTVPLEDNRTLSIPSIRMADHLQASTTSYTETTDCEDEDSLVYITNNDNASLSSRASSLWLPEDLGNDLQHIALPALQQHEENNTEQPSRRRKRKQQRIKEAYEWLQSVEVDQTILAEAASSKFLTSNQQHYDDYETEPAQECLHQQLRHTQPQQSKQPPRRQSSPSVFQRQISSPPQFT